MKNWDTEYREYIDTLEKQNKLQKSVVSKQAKQIKVLTKINEAMSKLLAQSSESPLYDAWVKLNKH